jgi:hypothetical protein
MRQSTRSHFTDYSRRALIDMGFLKSLSQSIKRSTVQQSPADSVTDSGFALPPSQVIETDIDTAGIKRPSGHGEIARRERRRSSTIGIFSFKPSGSDNRVIPSVSSRDHYSSARVRASQPMPFSLRSLSLLQLESGLAHDIADSTPRLPAVNEEVQLSQTENASSKLPRSSIGDFVAAPQIVQQSPRPPIPRGIIATPSSPRKPEHRRDTPGAFPAAHRRPRDAVASPLSPLDADVEMVNDREIGDPSTSACAAPVNSSNRYLGIGRPHIDSQQSSSPNRPHLLTVDSFSSTLIPTQRSASLPVRERENVAAGSNSPQSRSISFTSDGNTRSPSSVDDSRVDPQRQREEATNSKTIRKTRSFSDVLSRNRKGRMEEGHSVHKPLITWNATKQLDNENTSNSGNVTPSPSPPIPTTRKKSGNILKSAVDMFQFRKTRPSGDSNSGKEISSDTNAQEESQGSSPIVDVTKEASSERVHAVPEAPHIWPEVQVNTGTASTISENAPDDPLQRLQAGYPDGKSDSKDDTHESHGGSGQGIKIVASSSQPDSAPAATPAEPTGQVDDIRIPQRPTSNSRSRSGTTTPADWEFKRPHIGPRAQSTSSSTYGERPSSSGTNSSSWQSGGPISGASVSRSTTIRAVNMIRPRPTSDISAVSMSSSLRNSPQSSVDGFGQDFSQPVSILRSETPVSTPPSQSVIDSPSVSFVGGTPRISISSTSSQADSAKDQARAQRFASASQENVRNSLPVHNPKASRPRSSTLFSSPPVWLTSATLASPEKKRSTLMRRLSAGLIGPLDEKDKLRFQASPQELHTNEPDYFGEVEANTPLGMTSKIPDRDPGETTELWMARLSDVVKRTEIATVLASR